MPIASAVDLDSVYVSPNPEQFKRTSNGASDNNIRHIMKYEDSSEIRRIELAAYFSAASPTETISITDRNINKAYCKTLGNHSTADDEHIRVTLTTSGTTGADKVVYKIPTANVCRNFGGTNTYGSNNARFFARFPVPSGFNSARLTPDAATGDVYYRLGITIEYGAKVIGNANLGVSNSGSGSNARRQQILFRVQLNSAGCVPGLCTKYLSTVPINGGQQNYSTSAVSDNGNPAPHFTTQRFGFGLPCTVTTPQSYRVNVYDTDNGRDWDGDGDEDPIFFSIERRSGNSFVKIPFTNADVTNGTLTNGNLNIRPGNNSAETTSVMVTMQPYTQYRLTISPIWTSNLLGVGLPTETVFGDLGCITTLGGSITNDPATNPLETGLSTTFKAESYKTNNVDFNSTFNYTWRTWYDTGDAKYQQGVEATGCPAQNNVPRTQIGGGAQTLATCTMRSDATKSGGLATAMCAQLVMVATDGRTVIADNVKAPDGLIKCIDIGKYPHMEVRNGDIKAGGVFESVSPSCQLTAAPVIASSQRQINGLNLTSYATYGVTSLGLVSKFGSQGLSHGSPTSEHLIFANPVGIDQGYFFNPAGNTSLPTEGNCLNDPFADFSSAATTNLPVTDIDLSTPGLPEGIRLTNNVRVNVHASAPIPASKKFIIYAPEAAIHITGDIKYENRKYASLSQLPQVIIMTEENIIIHDQVRQIDGILAAKESLFTCDKTPTLKVCDQPLEINGAVVTGKRVVPLRTAGADFPEYRAMAETFNLRPDVLLKQVPEAGSTDVYVRTMSETEVPPRF